MTGPIAKLFCAPVVVSLDVALMTTRVITSPPVARAPRKLTKPLPGAVKVLSSDAPLNTEKVNNPVPTKLFCAPSPNSAIPVAKLMVKGPLPKLLGVLVISNSVPGGKSKPPATLLKRSREVAVICAECQRVRSGGKNQGRSKSIV